MEWTSLNDLREKFLSFYEGKGHLRLGSFSLIPKNDKSLLLINSGMAPMKKWFTGEQTPPRHRVTTCQKCIRTPDIDNVGKTARHGTFFEMLGNFSFGDYFKNEATSWAWEFCTEVLNMDTDKLWVTIYQDDDEAFDIWTKNVGVSPDRIVRMGKEDNFWEHGSGPCGPCSEIYYDRGPENGCGSPDCHVGCECDRFVEFWNLVFTQFDSDGNGNYAPLDHPNIDTGMGLERLACISQGVDNLFEVDTVQNIMKHLSRISGVEYKKDVKQDVSIRIITDHIRSTSFMIADGVFPSNEGRGYVLRRLIRRAARHGRLLGITKPFLSELCDTVIHESCGAYPELLEKKDIIKKIISVEEENFSKTIDQGLRMLDEHMNTEGFKTLSGEDAFKLYDTYGFPLDLTKDIIEEKGFSVAEDKFNELMKEQKDRARNARKKDDGEAWKGSDNVLLGTAPTEFVGYVAEETEAKVLAIVKDGELAESVSDGENAVIVLNKTSFYAESGGQVGDTGAIVSDSFTFNVRNTTKTNEKVFMHSGVVECGTVSVGYTVTSKIDVLRRNAIRRNHSAAHLLQAALRKTLGTHVEQAGQLVNENAVRFDFTHFEALSFDDIKKVETEVNKAILSGVDVFNDEKPIEEAKKMGAMALFGEKYGNVVRVVDVPGFSIELCGGTHVDNTSKIGLFKIVSESSVASGVRRIEALTGANILSLIDEKNAVINSAAEALKLNNPSELPQKCVALNEEIRTKNQTIEKLNSEIAKGEIKALMENAVSVGSVKIITGKFNGVQSDFLRDMCDKITDMDSSAVAVIAAVMPEKVTFAAAAGKEAVKNGAMSGKIVSAVAAVCGGKGGGRPDFAMAGGKDVTKTDEALSKVESFVEELLK